jgi:hypothetical protein
MKAALIVIGLSALAVLVRSIVLFAKERSRSTFVQLVGAGALPVAVVTHVGETFKLVLAGAAAARPGNCAVWPAPGLDDTCLS